MILPNPVLDIYDSCPRHMIGKHPDAKIQDTLTRVLGYAKTLIKVPKVVPKKFKVGNLQGSNLDEFINGCKMLLAKLS